MKKRYPIIIACMIMAVLIALLGHVSATYNQSPERGEETDCNYNYQIDLATKFFTMVDYLEMKNGYLGYRELTIPVEEPPLVKGIFITGWVAGLEGKMNEFIELARETEINAFVIDIKDDTGTISYQSEVPLAKEIKASRRKIKDIKALVKRLKEEDIYLIGRVVTFKDPMLAKAKFARALELKNEEQVWVDDEWINPYLRENWDYAVDLAKEALEFGFDEIQFDYVRFPALGKGPTQVSYETEMSKEDNINAFLHYAREELAKYGAPVSADIFGAVTSVNYDLGIGQRLESISDVVDIISPMVYPSHYAKGVFKLPVPEAAPYETIYHSMNDAVQRLSTDHPVRLRPWLQDFSLNYVYGVNEVKDQIRALDDLGIKEWLLWNPRSRYTEAALMEESADQTTIASEEHDSSSTLEDAVGMDELVDIMSN